ncbi:MAG: hypothetical protein WC217_01615 [Candidatus Paceibacterota bacterium]
MNKNIYIAGISALALAMSAVPAAAFAENGGGEAQGSESTQVSVTAQAVSESAREGQKQEAEVSREQEKQRTEIAREQEKNNLEAGSSTRPSIKGGDEDGQEIDLELEDDQDQALSNDDLNQKIEVRKHELEQEVASSTPDHQVAVEHANEVRLAVHALLASKDLIGGIGQQVSEIAKEVNNSVASTTNAEAKIQSRGFITRFLFGGDSTSAEVIAQEAAQNQARIDSLTALLGQANISADLQATLTAQITALKDAQARLQALADKEQKAWGLFSWRF